MVLRKVTKVGNSLGITFPAEMLKKANITLGDDIEIEYKDGEIILKKSQKVNLPEGVDAEFMELLNEVIKEHDEAFRGLVDK
ncbi:AbrB/MazE/SpoVT family DNA-binding domain-containing protein [Ammoniphilus sp. CFH 90114]|uniref:AbrB/MazE/SpoVT family DNA-binding domain-containing protein n=1 Tax=Ammoniphilus sp. CFH 90114 TaxID=2493665 RepID=UPI00100FD122|nr:AbrB/MazE/SpoVT family DNA-binding domain-containing protein [Ammoniphilus sp. CFH 90114]RXT08168.1 AbrB/MazE/SpoVT family DNA-binding domain-containing protein [Ammoniphilus sp. CFH 90114]